MVTLENPLVVAIAYDRLCSFEMGVATELFGLPRPELGPGWYRFEVVAADEPPLRTLGGLLSAPTDLTVLERAGTIVLPGWRDVDEAPPAALVAAIRAGHANGARVLSICSGAFLLAATGLLDGRAATTHWRHAAELARRFPAVEVRPRVLYVDNGSTLTSAGSAAGIDLGLHLIARDHGAAVAARVAKRLVLPLHREGGQAQYVDRPEAAPDTGPSLGAVLDWALANLDRRVTVEDLAARALMAPRTFSRLFRAEVGTTPHRWLARQRLARATELLETTDLSIDQVAAAVGFGRAATLRTRFRQALGTSPSAYRCSFGPAGTSRPSTSARNAGGRP